jgi:FkbM family methyltransferase
VRAAILLAAAVILFLELCLLSSSSPRSGQQLAWGHHLPREMNESPFPYLHVPLHRARSRRVPFENMVLAQVDKETSVFVPAGERTYADGNHAQERLFKRIYSQHCRAVSPRSVVVDVGGLLGDFSLRAASAGCSAVCFEANPVFADLIRAAVVVNGFELDMAVVHGAIGEVDGAVLFFVPGDHGGTGAFFPEPLPAAAAAAGSQISVPSYRLDRAISATQDILLVKIDVEGFDVAAVRSLEGHLHSGRVKHLIFEYTTFWDKPGQGRWDIVLGWLQSVWGAGPPPRSYALHRTNSSCYEIETRDFARFFSNHGERHLQTDVYVTWDSDFDPGCDGVWAETDYA